MPNSPSSLYKVSNNPGRPSRGAARAVVTSLAKRATRSVSGRKKGVPTIVETNPSSPSREPNLSDPKRRDMKATPPSHTHTKAKERASREVVPEEAADPVAGLNSGAGALSTDEAPLNRAGLDSTAKTLFAETSGAKKKAAPKNKSTNFFLYDQDKALEVALEQTVLERKKSEEDSAADGNANIDLSVDEYSGEIAAVAADEGKGEAGSEGSSTSCWKEQSRATRRGSRRSRILLGRRGGRFGCLSRQQIFVDNAAGARENAIASRRSAVHSGRRISKNWPRKRRQKAIWTKRKHSINGSNRRNNGSETTCGLLGILYSVRELCIHHGVESGSITLACDGLSAIRKALDADSTFSSRSSQFDLLSAIESVLLELPIKVNWRHVDGHQDDGRIGPLDR